MWQHDDTHAKLQATQASNDVQMWLDLGESYFLANGERPLQLMDDTLQQLRRHSENSRTRHKQKPDEKVDTHAIALVKAKQYHVCNEKIKRKVTYKMLLNIGIFRSLSKKLLKSLSHQFVTKCQRQGTKNV